jgi:hypothetical protein
MSAGFPIRRLVWSVAVALALGVASPSSAQTIRWKLDPSRGDTEACWYRAACGSYGVFSFEVEGSCFGPRGHGAAAPRQIGGAGGGPVVLGKVKDPPLYPQPAVAAGAGSSLLGPGATQLMPCAEGQCFSRQAELEDPWVAVVDWNNPHGWSVGWTVARASAKSLAAGPVAEVGLFALDEENLAPFATRGVTDVQVIAALCDLIERVEIGEPEKVPLPRVVNLSFGRYANEDDQLPCTPEDETKLGCQVRSVVRYLESLESEEAGYSTRVVASAGNHRQITFPALEKEIEAVEALDLEAFVLGGIAKPSWESPAWSGSAAWMPGAGLCLHNPTATAGWPAPPGSSYSAALYSGWLAAALVGGWIEETSHRVVWYPLASCTRLGCHFKMRGAGTVPVTAGLGEVLNRLMSLSGKCGLTQDDDGLELAATLEPVGAGSLPEQTLLELLAGVLVPTPEPNPCVPCMGGPRPPTRLARASLDPNVDVSFALPMAPGLELEDAYLRVEDTFYRLVVHGGLTPLAQGEVQRLRLVGGSEVLSGQPRQPSVVFGMRHGESLYWTSSPLWLTR